MKKTHTLYFAMLFLAGFFFFSLPASSQSIIEADIGLGLFEAESIKIKFGNFIKVGVSQGFFDGYLWLTGVEFYYHFADQSKWAEQRPSYFMCGLSSSIAAKGYDTFEKNVFYVRIGRSFHLSKKVGFNLDLGPSVLIAQDGIGGYYIVPLPTCSAHFFVRI